MRSSKKGGCWLILVPVILVLLILSAIGSCVGEDTETTTVLSTTGIDESVVFNHSEPIDSEETVTEVETTTEIETITEKKTETTTEKRTEADKYTASDIEYVLNTSSKKIHYKSCSSVDDIASHNYAETDDYDGAIADGYSPCGRCKPKKIN